MTASHPCRGALAAFALAVWCGLGPATPASAQTAAAGPILDVDAQLDFLLTARVVANRPIGKGVTGARRVTLSDGTRTHDAAFQAVNKEARGPAVPLHLRRSGELRFVDHYRYNIAAWRIARALGLEDMMPPTVERSIGKPGALSWWVDDVMMDEEQRQKRQALPPGGALELALQFARMVVFGELVRDTDRNKGNVIFTRSWRLVMLDFTRAFRLAGSLQAPADLNRCDRSLLARLRALTEPALGAAVQPHLTVEEVAAVMARRDLLVAHFDRLIAVKGEAAVLY